MDSPFLSIIVPVYNVEKYLNECVDSILASTFKDYEVILVDDGSKDNSGAICDDYAARFPGKIKAIHKANGGQSSARNEGLKEARGEFVGFIDSDDAILPTMYEEMIDAIRKWNGDICMSQFLCWDSTPVSSRPRPAIEETDGKTVLKRMLVWKENNSVCTKIFRRSIIGNLRFEEGKTSEDFRFLLELFLHNYRTVILEKGFYRYRVNDLSTTHTFKPSFFDLFDHLEDMKDIISEGDADLNRKFVDYAMTMHIMSAIKIKRNGKKQEYGGWLKKNRKFIRENLMGFLRNPHFSMRWKLKAFYGLI